MLYYLLEKDLRNYFKMLVFVSAFLLICTIALTIVFLITYHLACIILLIPLAIVTSAGIVAIPLCYKAYYKRIEFIGDKARVFIKNKYLYSIDLNTICKSMVNVRFIEGKYSVKKKCMVIHHNKELVENNMKFYWTKRGLLYVQDPELIERLNDNETGNSGASSVGK